VRGLIEHIQGRGDVELVEAREVAKRVPADDSLPSRKHEPIEIAPGLYP
jgi:hypothetical protein